MADELAEIDAPELGGEDTLDIDGEYDLIGDLEDALNPGDEESTDESEGDEDDDTSDTEDQDGETVRVKVDGEEIEVTLEELKAGYSRQADYTKKTQALAREREQMTGLVQLAEALQANPEAAIAELARAFDVSLGAESAEDSSDVEFDLDDPVERKLAELEAFRAEVEAEREASRREAMDRELQHTLDSIKGENDDPEMDEDALLQFAVDHQIADLRIAYELKTAREGRTKPVDEEPPALKAKRNAPPVETATRRGARKGTGKIGSIADALRDALSEHDG